jgi:MoxR-like ATPase
VSKEPRAALERIKEAEAFGRGNPTGEAGDDRRGHFWLITGRRTLVAVQAALLTGRPLLVEGPSGTGKSALARAVSESLGWTYYETVVTSQTRLDTLTGWVDLIQRLHQAELASRAGGDDVLPGLEAFVKPGVLWWALDPASAATAGKGDNADIGTRARNPASEDGAVVLIDEIDKAEPDLPNNLLVPLGSWELRVEGRAKPVGLTRSVRPLVVITSNQERDMPPAFLRRCVKLRLGYPHGDALSTIAHRHVIDVDDETVKLVRSKFVAEPNEDVSPAEFIDAVRAVQGLRIDGASSEEVWRDLESIVLGHRRNGDAD